MDNQNEWVGVSILMTQPSDHAMNVNVHSSFQLTFSADLNPKTLVGNVIVFKDLLNQYENVNTIKEHKNDFAVVKGSVSYKERVVTFTPSEAWELDRNYILMINDVISDVTGHMMAKKYAYVFHTESEPSYLPCQILAPKYGTICAVSPVLRFESQGAPSYRIQISKAKEFDVLLYDELVEGNTEREISKQIPSYPEGIYFFRIRAENGPWSEIGSFFIKENTDSCVTQEDEPIMNFDEFLDQVNEPIEVLGRFPEIDDLLVNPKIHLCYLKLRGQVSLKRFEASSCYISHRPFDGSTEESEEMNSKFQLVYDAEKNVTYAILSFHDPLTPLEEGQTDDLFNYSLLREEDGE